MTRQEEHARECEVRRAREKAKSRPYAGWLQREANEKELDFLRDKIKSDQEKLLYGDK
jgi:hypothetical protein